MKHPFEILRPEYSQLLSAMVIRSECLEAANDNFSSKGSNDKYYST